MFTFKSLFLGILCLVEDFGMDAKVLVVLLNQSHLAFYMEH